MNATDLNAQLQNSQTTLQNILGIPITDFAAPNGTSNTTTSAAVAHYYASQRLTSGPQNIKTTFNPYAIYSNDITNNVATAQVQGWIDQAIANNGWLVILVHGVNPTMSSNTYSTTTDILNATLSYLQSKGVAVETMQQALTEINSQM